MHEDGEIISIPILSFPGVVLMPGQLLPLHLFRDADIAMVKYCLDRDRTFGQLKIMFAFFFNNLLLVCIYDHLT